MSLTNRQQIHQLTQIAILAALTAGLRILFSGLPNIQPMTAIFLIIAQVWPMRQSLTLICLSLVLSNVYLGMGPWTLMQMMSYIIILSLTYGLQFSLSYLGIPSKAQFIVFAINALLSGFVYGLIISALWVSLLKAPFWPYYLRGLSFDTLHAGGNLVFYLILAPILLPLLYKLRRESKLASFDDD